MFRIDLGLILVTPDYAVKPTVAVSPLRFVLCNRILFLCFSRVRRFDSLDRGVFNIQERVMPNARVHQQTISTDGGDVKSRFQLVSAKTLAKEWDASSTSVRRWLQAAGIEPVAVGRGRNGAVRYFRSDVQRWMDSLERLG